MAKVEERPTPIPSENELRAKNIDSQFDALWKGSNGWEKTNKRLHDEIKRFFTHVDQENGIYNAEESEFLKRTLKVATVFHQMNEAPGKDDRHPNPNFRREKYPDGSPIPYITHPLAVAGALAGLGRVIKLGHGEQKHNLPLQQQPLRAEIVAAGLLHDVVEDVRYGEVQGESLFEITEAYVGSGVRFNKTKRMVQAVTHETRGSIDDTTKRMIHQSRLCQAMDADLMSHTDPKDLEEVRKKLVYTLVDINKLFQVGFPHASVGMTTPEDIEVFFGAFAVKLHDMENNLETDVRRDKLMRAHLFAAVARAMDYPVASRLALHLIADQNYSLFGRSHANEQEQELVGTYLKEEAIPQQLRKLSVKRSSNSRLTAELQITANQIPITLASERRGDGGVTDPVMQYKIHLPRPFLWLARTRAEDKAFKVPAVLKDGTECTLVRMTNPGHARMRKWKRDVVYYRAIGNEDGKTLAIVRCSDNKPTPYDLIRQNSTAAIEDVPEVNMVPEYDGTFKSTLTLLGEFSPFTLTA